MRGSDESFQANLDTWPEGIEAVTRRVASRNNHTSLALRCCWLVGLRASLPPPPRLAAIDEMQ